LVHEKERYKNISEELDSTFQELSGYWAGFPIHSTMLGHCHLTAKNYLLPRQIPFFFICILPSISLCGWLVLFLTLIHTNILCTIHHLHGVFLILFS
jgi:hypothetical protein